MQMLEMPMTFTKSMIMTALLCATSVFAPAISRAEVVDDGGFFSAEAVTTANETLGDLQKKTGHDVRIETHATVATDKIEAVAKMSAAEREKFFSNWLHDRAEATKSRGVFILICKEPGHLRLWAGRPLQNAGFGANQAKAIREPLLAGFRAKDYDKALKDCVAQAVTTLNELKPASKTSHQSAAPIHPGQHRQAHAQNGVGFGSMFTVLAVIIGGVLVFSMIARLFGGGGSGSQSGAYGPGYGGQGGYGGGGGFMRGLAGGIFGAMAGNWMYDQFSGRHAHGNDTWSNSDYSGGDSGSSLSDSGFSGGTDFGGGDFGGGDFGGGGDF